MIIVPVRGIAQSSGCGCMSDSPNTSSVDGLPRFSKCPSEDLAEPSHYRWWGHFCEYLGNAIIILQGRLGAAASHAEGQRSMVDGCGIDGQTVD